jgi:hypothetical protein
MSIQSKVTSTSLDKSASTSKSVDELLDTRDLESSDDSDSSLFKFARDLGQQNEAVKALQLLSTSTSNSTTVNTNLLDQTSLNLTVNETEYTNMQLYKTTFKTLTDIVDPMSLPILKSLMFYRFMIQLVTMNQNQTIPKLILNQHLLTYRRRK